MHDALAVSQECLKMVHKKGKKDSTVVSSFALTDQQLDHMLRSDAAGGEEDPLLASVPGAGRDRKTRERKPPGWKPNIKTEFCAG